MSDGDWDGRDQRRPKRFEFVQRMTLGDALTIISVVGSVIGFMFTVHGSLKDELHGIKAGQAVQAIETGTIRREIGDVKDEQRRQGATLRNVEDRVNRARL